MSKPLRIIGMLALVTAGFGCAVGNVYDYRTAPVVLPVKGDLAVKVAVIDQRSYVLEGDKEPDFIGLRRGGFGNPFNVTTASGETLASDFTAALGSALENAGYTIAEAGQAERTLTLTIREWKSDVYTNLKLLYDVTLVVTDRAGEELASNTIKGDEPIGGGAMMGQHDDSVRRAFEAKMSQLFADPAVKSALSS